MSNIPFYIKLYNKLTKNNISKTQTKPKIKDKRFNMIHTPNILLSPNNILLSPNNRLLSSNNKLFIINKPNKPKHKKECIIL